MKFDRSTFRRLAVVAGLALASQAVKDQPRLRSVLLVLGIFGTAIFYGDGVITPAISVLSAIEGLRSVPALADQVTPAVVLSITISILSMLLVPNFVLVLPRLGGRRMGRRREIKAHVVAFSTDYGQGQALCV